MSSVDVEIAEIKKDIKHICNLLSNKCEKIDKHIEESDQVRIDVHDNTKFRNSCVWSVRTIYCAIVGILIKLWFLK